MPTLNDLIDGDAQRLDTDRLCHQWRYNYAGR